MEDHRRHGELSREEVPVRLATSGEAEAIARLVNEAFRVEAFFVDGDRTQPDEVLASFEKGTWLVVGPVGRLAGCVLAEERSGAGHFAMLAVDPTARGLGIAARLLAAVEDWTRARSFTKVGCLIVSVREELLPFYRKHGYQEAGTEPFPAKTKIPCHFVHMEKDVPPRGI